MSQLYYLLPQYCEDSIQKTMAPFWYSAIEQGFRKAPTQTIVVFNDFEQLVLYLLNSKYIGGLGCSLLEQKIYWAQKFVKITALI